MKNYLKVNVILLIVITLISARDSRDKRGLGNFLSKLKKKTPEKSSLIDVYDPKEHLYSQFLNSSFVNKTLSAEQERSLPVYHEEEVIHGKGILDLFKGETTKDPKEKQFLLYLKSLDDNKTLSSTARPKTSTPSQELIKNTSSTGFTAFVERKRVMGERKELTATDITVKENLIEGEEELPERDSENAMTPRYEEQTTVTVREFDDYLVTRKHDEGFVPQRGEYGMRKNHKSKKTGRKHKVSSVSTTETIEETSAFPDCPNEIKYLFPNQL